jgi:polysaccharide biosynthesis protein PslG
MTRKQILLLAIVMALSVGSSAWGQTPATFFGMNTGRLPSTQPWPSVQFGSIRLWDTGTTWNDLEPTKNVYDWTTLDQYLALAETNHDDVLYTFGGTAQWAAAGTGSQCVYNTGSCYPPANIQDWDQFVSAVVAHSAGKIKYWEIWNEANLPGFYSGDTATLVLLAQHAYQIIKAANPNYVVLCPSSSGAALLVEAYLNTYFAAGGAAYTDAVAFHGYVGSIPEGILYLETKIQLAMAANGLAGKPLWDTEGGWGLDTTLTNPDLGPGYMAKEYLLQASSGVARAYWYEWNSPTWGTLWTTTGGIQPSGVAYGELYKWIEGATMNNSCVMATNSTWTCTLTRPGGYQALAVWNQATTMSYTPASEYKFYNDLAGNTHPITGAVTIGYTPILLVPSVGPLAPTGLSAIAH